MKRHLPLITRCSLLTMSLGLLLNALHGCLDPQNQEGKNVFWDLQAFNSRMLLDLGLGQDIPTLTRQLRVDAEGDTFIPVPTHLPALAGLQANGKKGHTLRIEYADSTGSSVGALPSTSVEMNDEDEQPHILFWVSKATEGAATYDIITGVEFNRPLVYTTAGRPDLKPYAEIKNEPVFMDDVMRLSESLQNMVNDFSRLTPDDLHSRRYSKTQLASLKSHLIILGTFGTVRLLQYGNTRSYLVAQLTSANTDQRNRLQEEIKQLDTLLRTIEEFRASTETSWLYPYTNYVSPDLLRRISRFNFLRRSKTLGQLIAALVLWTYYIGFQVASRRPFLLFELAFDGSAPRSWKRRVLFLAHHPLYWLCPIITRRRAQRMREVWNELGRRILEQEAEKRRRQQSEEALRRNTQERTRKEAEERRKSCVSIAEQAKGYWHKLAAYTEDGRDELITAYATATAGAECELSLNERLTALEILRKAFDPPKPPQPPPPPPKPLLPPPNKREQVERLRGQIKEVIGDEVPDKILELAPRHLEIVLELVTILQVLEPGMVSRFLGQIYSLEKPGMLLEGSTANVIRRRKIGPIRETLGLPQAAEMDKAVSIVPS